MGTLSDLNGFVNILTGKGYDGYFHTQGAYAGKLKESISEYLQNCRNGTEAGPKPELLLTGYLQWSGEDNPSVKCNMWVKYQDGKFDLIKMAVRRNDRFGRLMRQVELTNLSAATAPKAAAAIAMVSDAVNQKITPRNKRFRL